MRSDLQLQRDVLEELKSKPRINAAHIGVAVSEGVVTLTEHVSSYAERIYG
jgi:osmotically-inducible protein OsmY